MATFGERLKIKRKKAGLTQKQLAERLGIAYQNVGQWESGNRVPKWDASKRIAEALGISMAELWGFPMSPKIESYEYPDFEPHIIGANIKKQWIMQGYTTDAMAKLSGHSVESLNSIEKREDYEFGLSELMRFSAILGIFWADFVDDDPFASTIWLASYPEDENRLFFPQAIVNSRREFYNRNKNLALYVFGQLNPAEQEALLKELQKQQAPMPAPSIKSSTDEEGQKKMQQSREAVAELHLNAPADDTDSKDGGQ